MKSYLQTLLITFTLLVLISTGFSWHAIQSNLLGFVYTTLTDYQLSKIEQADNLDLAIVGDSSGGNAINSQLLGEQLGLNTISLSLTGAFGYGGSYIMARRAAEKGAKTIVLVHTMDMLTRPLYQDHRAGVFLIRSFRDLLRLVDNLHHLLSLYLSRDIVATAIKQTFKSFKGDQKRLKEDSESQPHLYDYIKQNPPMDPTSIDSALSKKMIRPEKRYYLYQLAHFCSKNGINCYYAYGPIHHSFCQQSLRYLEHSNQLIQETGIELLTTTPYCMQDSEVGDSEDHIKPELKALSTNYYAEKIGQILAESGRSPRTAPR